MTKKLEIYKCSVCGNVVQVLLPGMEALVCCGEKMQHLAIQNSNDERTEIHSPLLTKTKNGEIEVSVKKHPMERNHFINFIETISEDQNEVRIKYFIPCGEAVLNVPDTKKPFTARSYCNIHGVYQNK